VNYKNRETAQATQELTMKSPAGPSERRKRSRMLDAEVGLSIRIHRKNAKMTLQSLADKLGIAYQQVQKYETGVNRIGAGRLMEIAEILGVPVSSFFDIERRHAPNTAPDADAALQGRQLLASYLRIRDPEKRRMVLAYVHSMADESP
jgi:transcriptional regulator with XRE-family HTH domain